MSASRVRISGLMLLVAFVVLAAAPTLAGAGTLLFSNGQGGGKGGGTTPSHMYSVSEDGGGVADLGEGWQPSASPNGRQMAYLPPHCPDAEYSSGDASRCFSDGVGPRPNWNRVWVGSLDGGGGAAIGPVARCDPANGGAFTSVAWSPAGDRIAAADCDLNGHPSIVDTMNSAGGDVQTIFDDSSDTAPWLLTDLSYTPDGGSILLGARRYEIEDENYDVGEIPATGLTSSPSLLTTDAASSANDYREPRVTADGDLSYTDPEQHELIRIDADGTRHVVSSDVFLAVPDAEGSGYDAVQWATGDLVHLDHDGSNERIILPYDLDTTGNIDWLDTVPAPTAVTITAGPSGTVSSSSATFEMAAPGEASPDFECSLDDADFAACNSPVTYSGLAEGEHSFKVRLGDDGDPTTQTWTVDTTPPTTTIDGAPSGAGNPPQATITFHGSDADDTFSCSLDGAAPTDCSSPQQLLALSDGSHTFSVQATDSAGNVELTPQTVSWTVASSGSGGGGGAGCAGAQLASAGAGELWVKALPGGCLTPQVVNDRAVDVAHGPVMLDGVTITPASGTTLTFDPTLEGGTFSTSGPVIVSVSSISWPVTGPFSWSTAEQSLAGQALPRAKSSWTIAGLPLTVAPTFTLSAADGGSATAKVTLAFPTAFSALPGPAGASTGGLTSSFTFSTSNNSGPRFQAKAVLAHAYLFGSVPVENVSVAYDSRENTFSGAGTLQLGGASYTLGVELGPNGLFGLLRSASIDVSGLQKPLGYGFFLQRLGGSISKQGDNPRLTSSATVSFGPELDLGSLFKGSVASIDGTAQLAFANPMTLTFSGTGKIVDVEVAQASTSFSTDGYSTLSGKLNLALDGYGFHAGIDNAWFDYPAGTFDVEAHGQLTLPGLAGRLLNGDADVVLSNRGFAACFGQEGVRIGFVKAWGSSVEPMGDSCDVGPLKQPNAHQARAAGADRTLTVPPNATVRVLALEGAGAPPAAAIRGPGAAALSTGRAGRLVDSRAGLAMQDPRTDTTYLVLIHPRAGIWHLHAPATTRFRLAGGLPPVHVKATVSSSRAGRYVVHWRTGALSGQRLVLTDASGRNTRRITITARARGAAAWTPAAGGRHVIVAAVLRDGFARGVVTVAHLRIRLPELTAPRHIRRSGRRLSWQPEALAVNYLVQLTRSGTTTTRKTSRPDVVVPAAVTRVEIVAISADGRASRPAVLSLTAK